MCSTNTFFPVPTGSRDAAAAPASSSSLRLRIQQFETPSSTSSGFKNGGLSLISSELPSGAIINNFTKLGADVFKSFMARNARLQQNYSCSSSSSYQSNKKPAGGASSTTILAAAAAAAEGREEQMTTMMGTSTSTSTAGTSRWNPTREQVGFLESLYRRGVRTPNARQIEQITAELRKHGRIEGKNVFYWFQNHKARERQKQKRAAAALALFRSSTSTSRPRSSNSTHPPLPLLQEDDGRRELKRQRRISWSAAGSPEEREDCGCCDDKTLELFPLHPERR